MQYFVYILFSLSKNRYYIGYTSNLEERLIRHNQKAKSFTGSVNDWVIVYREIFLTKEEAIARESKIKSWKSRVKIEELVKLYNDMR